jgi:ribosomal protein L18
MDTFGEIKMTYRERYNETMRMIHEGFDHCIYVIKDDPVLIVIGRKSLKAINKVMKTAGCPRELASKKYGIKVGVTYEPDLYRPIVINRKHFEYHAKTNAHWKSLKEKGIVK